MGAQAAPVEKRRHPGMHRTRTLDYAIVLSGEIYAVLDEGEVLLEAGDVLVQRGTNHAWSNRSDRPCRIAFVLVDAA
jgi:quercetin dioxygenase-like cupin family protein